MGRLSMATRKELTTAVSERYRASTRAEKARILDEFVVVTGFHRKHAMRLLRRGEGPFAGRRARPRIYDEAERNALILLWEASDRVCGKRLKALLPILLEAMERHGHFDLAPEIRGKLLAMSAATIDRTLGPIREGLGRPRRRPAAHALRRSIPIRTSADWDDPAPGFVEADLVAHSGPSARGSFIQTLVLTDIATGWTECAPLLVREQTLLSTVLTELRKQLPFALLGLDTDNDTVFMNETLKAYCVAANIVFTRCRPYRKNDQAFVEQKNGAVVRRMVGYRRFEGLEAATLLAKLYRSARLFVNFFQPSFKLIAKQRDGARVRKTYSPPATPHQRLVADPRTSDAVRSRLQEIYAGLDPVLLLRDIRAVQERLAALADTPPAMRPDGTAQPIDLFLASLRTAWKDGAIRPTDRPIVKAKRGRRRPDPLVKATADLRNWFEAEPWRTGSELLSRLQAEYPGDYPDKLLRTLQRRLKVWRSEQADALLFGPLIKEPPILEIAGPH
ncbi:integrase [Mesorhizobium loti]|uniref:Integrase n=1 Tax=Rhizobium loti TaxID=381 RepID=A0A1A5Q7Q6_RHILI|nr:integrase [Mesorhizobium loti]OBP73535.1 integrase [Mesorhizobium loti]OBQ63741.1 integrase [Mesorhizobium loti]QKC73148.1 ISNCY family transposase [Mesorhizobium loti]QKC73238.1 ISNCY family transposase [Mesorhizobium loti]QKC73260.1 ISNCY family transposase [Mesorhizobium loti]